MFTGLVTDCGIVEEIDNRKGLTRLKIASSYPAEAITMGASIMHSGVCLTVVAFGAREGGSWWEVEAVPETLSRTNLGALKPGNRVNLEQSLRVGDELGGHFVFGHVDGMAEIARIVTEGEGYRVTIRPPADLIKYMAAKGSVAVDGISLTVASVSVEEGSFDLAIIPHTWDVTTLGDRQAGDHVNIEIDMLARYVERLVHTA